MLLLPHSRACSSCPKQMYWSVLWCWDLLFWKLHFNIITTVWMLPLPRHVPLSVDSMLYFIVCVLLIHLVIWSVALYVYTHIQFICVLFFHLCFLYLLENNHYNGYECFCKNISFHFCRVVGHGTFPHSSSHAVLSMLSLILFAGIIGMPKNVLYSLLPM